MTTHKLLCMVTFAAIATVLLTGSMARADVYTDLGAIHNTGLAPVGTNGVVVGGNENTGRQLTPFGPPSYDFAIPALSPATAGNTPDFEWIHEFSAFNVPATGTRWSFGGVFMRQAILLPSIDHGPIPFEGLETTLWGSPDGGSSWVPGTLVEVYDMGWSAGSIDDDFASRWTFPIAVNMISATPGLAQSIYSYVDGDTEIDAVQALTFCGDGITQTPNTSGFNEACDNAGANSDTTPDACRTDCTLPRCGDGVQDTGEECDVVQAIGGGPPVCLSTCKLVDEPVPAVSEWGLIVMGLLGLTVGTILCGRRRTTTASAR